MPNTIQKIKVCNNCEAPLIWTFCFPYAEYFCMNCGFKGGMFGSGKDVDLTPELKLKKKLIDTIWHQLYGKGLLLPPGEYTKDKCKKCNSGEYHNDHLSKLEKQKNKLAWRILKSFKGKFN
jgi:hypothetical protein